MEYDLHSLNLKCKYFIINVKNGFIKMFEEGSVEVQSDKQITIEEKSNG